MLGNGADAELVRKLVDSRDDSSVAGILLDALDEAAVDFQVIHWQRLQIT